MPSFCFAQIFCFGVHALFLYLFICLQHIHLYSVLLKQIQQSEMLFSFVCEVSIDCSGIYERQVWRDLVCPLNEDTFLNDLAKAF